MAKFKVWLDSSPGTTDISATTPRDAAKLYWESQDEYQFDHEELLTVADAAQRQYCYAVSARQVIKFHIEKWRS
jgi:hypothetical protein